MCHFHYQFFFRIFVIYNIVFLFFFQNYLTHNWILGTLCRFLWSKMLLLSLLTLIHKFLLLFENFKKKKSTIMNNVHRPISTNTLNTIFLFTWLFAFFDQKKFCFFFVLPFDDCISSEINFYFSLLKIHSFN